MKKTSGIIWNMIGSTCYSASSVLYLMVATRVCGAEEAGFFSLAYATAQLLLSIGRYGMRTYQATDLRSQYSYYEYLISRAISVAAMMILGAAYSVFSFEGKYIAVSLLVVGMKAIDAVEDIYHGRLQQTYHIEQMGQSQFIRNLYTTICFSLVLFITKNLVLTLLISVASSVVLCIIMNHIFIRKLGLVTDSEKKIEFSAVMKLLRSCTGIMVGTFLSLLLFNIPKYAMEGVLSAEYQTYYSILFMPAFVVTLLCEFVFRPTITSMADKWFSGNRKGFNRALVINLGLIIGASAFVTLAGHLIGRRLLEILYSVDLSPYKAHFIVLLAGGGVGACVYMIYNVLIAIRHGNSIKTVYGITAVISVLSVKPLITHFSMMGAALNYLLTEVVLLVIFAALLIKILLKKEPQT